MMGQQILLPLLLLLVSSNSFCQTSVMSYNIRYNNPNDGDNWWENRKEEVVDLLEYYHPEFIGIQEGMNDQVAYLDSLLKDYAFFGFGRDGEGSISEAVPIFYDSTRFEMIKGQVYWLSETPEVVSKGWDAALNRIVTYGAFRNKEQGDTVHIFNAHFDHMGKDARANSAKVILDKISELKLFDEKVVIMGDFNCIPTDTPYQILTESLDDAMKITSNGLYGPEQ